MARGGFRPGAGRPKGTKATKEIKAMAAVLDAAPAGSPVFKTAKEFAMWVINNDGVDLDSRLRAMQAVLPFTDSRIADAVPGKKEQRAEAAKEAARGKFAAPAPPKLAIDNTKR